MYSQNDYRYYLEHRLFESDDYLAHYSLLYCDNYLAHHGVKGMKWGVRKSDASISRQNRKRQKVEIKKKLANEKRVYKEVRKGINGATRISSRDFLSGKISNQDYDDLMDTYAQMHIDNKALHKVEKRKIKHPDNFNKTYSYIKPYMESKGSTADNYIVTATTRKGDVKKYQPVWNSGPLQEVNATLKSTYETRESIRKKRR